MKKIERYSADNDLPNEKAVRVSESDLDELEQQAERLEADNIELQRDLELKNRAVRDLMEMMR